MRGMGDRAAGVIQTAGRGVAHPAHPAGCPRTAHHPDQHAADETVELLTLGSGQAGQRGSEHGCPRRGRTSGGPSPGRSQPDDRRACVVTGLSSYEARVDEPVDKPDCPRVAQTKNLAQLLDRRPLKKVVQ
jgi:hypothetical protein